MTNIQYLLLFSLALYALVSVYIVVRIVKTTILTLRQKRVNIVLSVLLPFFWPALVFYMLKREPDWSDKKRYGSISGFTSSVYTFDNAGGDFGGSHGGCHH